MMDSKLLAHWIDEGLAVKDVGDGAWGWTESTKRRLPHEIQTILGWILYGDKKLESFELEKLKHYGFDTDGMVLMDT